jgi:hypothetical protein
MLKAIEDYAIRVHDAGKPAAGKRHLDVEALGSWSHLRESTVRFFFESPRPLQ